MTAVASLARGGTSRAALAVVLVLGVLLAATGYEIAIALGAFSVGPAPGQGPAGETAVLLAALLALLAGSGLSAYLAGRTDAAPPAAALLAPAGSAFATVRFYTFDPYYAPALRRMSDGGMVAPGWVFCLAAAAVVVATVTMARPRPGLLATVPLLLVCALTALVEDAGH